VLTADPAPELELGNDLDVLLTVPVRERQVHAVHGADDLLPPPAALTSTDHALAT
jgi:hypothetical protein